MNADLQGYYYKQPRRSTIKNELYWKLLKFVIGRTSVIANVGVEGRASTWKGCRALVWHSNFYGPERHGLWRRLRDALRKPCLVMWHENTVTIPGTRQQALLSIRGNTCLVQDNIFLQDGKEIQ